ncbi:MAG: tRNA pseudouridine(55) synthase [Myxococcaceae bacterium]
MQPGLYLAHKPVGATSFETLNALALGDEKKCHGGTLDPFAHGLLLILVGQTTRLFERFHVLPKTYVAELVWGKETDTGDLLGTVTLEGDASTLTPALLAAALVPFQGWTWQVPPATSAKKIGGEPAYRKAHRGEVVVLPPSQVYLHSARWLSHELPRSSRLELVVRGGFYVRSLARDLGRALGMGAHVATLHRSTIGPWGDPSVATEVIGAAPVPSELTGLFGAAIVPWLRRRSLTATEADQVRAWKQVSVQALSEPSWLLPEGFRDEGPPIAAMVKNRLIALLDSDGTPRINFSKGL